jgi:hypothetical protein
MDSLRIFRMNPLAVDFDHFKINSVTLDGVAYTHFDPDNRLLTLPPHTAGQFAVTYKSTKTYVADVPEVQAANALPQLHVYPNPVSDMADFQIYLPKASAITICIFDIYGRLKEQISNNILPAGNHTIEWRPSAYTQGMYIVQLKACNQVTTMKVSVSK